MFKPLFFTAMFSLVSALAQIGEKAGTPVSGSPSVKPCTGGMHWDQVKKRCVAAPDA